MDIRQRTIGLLPLDGFALLAYAAVVEPLRAANLLAAGTPFSIRHFAIAGTATRSSSGALIEADAGLGATHDLDLLILIAGGDPMRADITATAGWLRRLDRSGLRLGGVSGGPVILARAGLMHNRRMTVHWEHAAELAEFDPDLLLERALYVIDRDRITCAGGTAPLDLMHALITEWHGHAFARQVSDWFMHTEIRASGDPQRAGIGERYDTTEPKLIAAIEAMENHIAAPLGLDQLGLLCGISGRQLNRLFQTHLRQSVMRFYRHLRLEKSASLLARSQITLAEVAQLSGFASQSHLTTAFTAHFGSPPQQFRRHRRSIPAAPSSDNRAQS